MIRLTIKDQEQSVSFLTDRETILRLVAGCSVNPVDLGELLLATEIYQPGITAGLMAGLMTFDKRLRREGLAFIREGINEASASGQPLTWPFQVVDEASRQEAFVPRACDLVVFNLTQKTIETSEGVHIPVTEEISIHSGEGMTSRKVTYVLPQDWTIKLLPG